MNKLKPEKIAAKQLTILFSMFCILVSCRKDNISSTALPKTYYKFKGTIGAVDKSTIITNDKNIVIYRQNNNNIFIQKNTTSGLEIWRQEYSIANLGFTSSIVENSNDELFFLEQNSHYVILKKLNSLGNTIWSKSFEDSRGLYARHHNKDIITFPNGNTIFNTVPDRPSFEESILIKVNSNGDTLWTNFLYQGIMQLTKTDNEEIIVTGYTGDGLHGYTLKILKLNLDGTELWNSHPSNLPLSTYINSVSKMASGELIMAGQCHYTATYDSQGNPSYVTNSPMHFYIFKIDNSGNLVFSKTFGTTGKANSIKANKDGTFTILGIIDGKSGIMKIDQNGEQIWWKLIEGENPINLQKTDNDENVITGNHSGNIFMVKTNSEGITL